LNKRLELGAMALFKIGNSDLIIPYKGKTYKNLEEVELQYYKYASEKGFSIRKGTTIKVDNQLRKMSLF